MVFVTVPRSRISEGNSSQTPLAATATFIGTGEPVSDYISVTVSVFSDVGSGEQGLKIQHSSDNEHWDFEETFTVYASTGFSVTRNNPCRYLRVVYENGSAAQTDFRLQTMYRTYENHDTETKLVEGARVGISAGVNLDAFSRLRCSSPLTVFDSKQVVQEDLFWDDVERSGSGTASTYHLHESATTLSVSAHTPGVRIRQSKKYMNYQPGKSQLIVLTGILKQQVSGNTARIGYFDDRNGLYFQSSGEGVSVVRRSYVTQTVEEEIVPQSAWNLDRMDGQGPSHITLDIDKTHIFVIDFQWLGVGRVRFGFDINGVIYYVHQMLHANVLDQVYMSSPNLPLRVEMQNDGTATEAGQCVHICSMVMTEGGQELNGYTRTLMRGSESLNLDSVPDDDSLYVLLAFRLKPTHLHATVTITSINIMSTTNTNAFRWVLMLNPSIDETTHPLDWQDVAHSSVQLAANSDNTNVLSQPGTIILGGYARGNNNTNTLNITGPHSFPIGSTIDGMSDVVVLAVETFSMGEDFYGAITIDEQF